MRALLLLSSLLLIVPALPPSAAQDTGFLFAFSFEAVDKVVVIDRFPGTASAHLTFQDRSTDGVTSYVPGAPPAPYFQHQVSITTQVLGDVKGWFPPPVLDGFASSAQSPPVDVTLRDVLVTAGATAPRVTIRVTAVMTDELGHRINHTADVLFIAAGFPSIQIRPGPSLRLSPRELTQASVTVTSDAIYARRVEFVITDNPCGLTVAPPAGTILEPGEERVITFSVQAPADGFYYQSLGCGLSIGGTAFPASSATDGTSYTISATQVHVTVDGFYLAPEWIFWFLVIALLIFLLVLFVRRRKERIEERILGKPQKPWLIPVEKVYLRELRKKDARAWYVVRNYLMEEEYRSAMLWFRAYKAATKGSRKKEALILKQEEAYTAWKAKWAKRIAAPIKAADKFEAKLQRKLDRKARKLSRKDKRKWRKLVKKAQAKHAASSKKAAEKHAKAVAKARKKGLPVPAAPVAAAPLAPEQPAPRRILLSEHRWAKKAARFRRRRVREQGNLEVKFEKQDARYLAKLRRKVRRIARRLDDPDFVREHPLLAGTTES